MLSGAILAGGQSRRMGRDKALLTLAGRTLLEWQVDKLRKAGVEDIMLSGHRAELPDARYVEDVYVGCGPLGGLHACLAAARHDLCVVLSVDVPLIPAEALAEMAMAHLTGKGDATILKHGDRIEPLIGVYSRALLPWAERALWGSNRSMRAFLDLISWQSFAYDGPEAALINVNTPEEYEGLRAMLRQGAQAGVIR